MKLGEMTGPDVKPWIRTNKFPSTPLSHSNSTGPHQLFLTDTMETEEVIARLERRLPMTFTGCRPDGRATPFTHTIRRQHYVH